MHVTPESAATAPVDRGNADVRPAGAPTSTVLRYRKIVPAAVAGIALVACIVVALVWSIRSDQQSAGVVMPSQGVTMLVETFEARASDDQTTLIAQGLSHEVATALLRFPDLRVHLMPEPISREAGATLQGNASPQGGFVVTGAVWRESGDVFVRVELIRRADQQILWSERYTEGAEARSLTEIQDEISSRIASVVGQ